MRAFHADGYVRGDRAQESRKYQNGRDPSCEYTECDRERRDLGRDHDAACASIRVTSDVYGSLLPAVDDGVTTALEQRFAETTHRQNRTAWS